MNAEEILHGAVEKKTPAERAAYLDIACGDNRELRSQVEGLLRAHEEAGSFLEQPLFEPRTTVNNAHSPERPGAAIGPYKLLQQLGEGGMGAVFLAEQTQPVQRKVALKVIKPGMDSRHVLARFEQERQALALMDHPHIAKVLDAGTTASERPFFVMELVKGVPITSYCDQEQLTPKERLELFIPVCQAVQHAHQKGIIHRDLKPSNVLIALYDGKPVPKVIDFGVAKAIDQKLTEKTMFTEVGQIVGTLEYMAPEQAELNNLDIDTRADIYALGTLLYQLLTGSPPFTREQLRGVSFAEMLRIIREVEPPKPSTKLSSSAELSNLATLRKLEPKRLTRLVQGDLDWIVMKCLEKDRTRRYETANALAMDIGRYLADEPVLAGPPSFGYKARKFVRRNRVTVLAATIVLLTLIGGITGTAWGLVEAQRHEDVAVKAMYAEAEQRRKVEDERDAKEKARAEAAANEQKAKEATEKEKEQRAKVETEKQIAQAGRNFLLDDLLLQADADEQAYQLRSMNKSSYEIKENPTVKELLDRAAIGLTSDRIEDKFPNRPLVQAEILLTVGLAFDSIGDYEKAISHLKRSSDLMITHLGRDNTATVSALTNLGRIYHAAGKTKDAIILLEQLRDPKVFNSSLDQDKILYHLATAYETSGRRRDAIEILEKLRDSMIAKHGPGNRHTLITLEALGVLYGLSGNLGKSIELLETVRDLRVKTLGPKDPSTLFSIYNLSQAYHAARRTPEAIELLEKVKDLQIAQEGSTHPHTLLSLSHLASMYNFIGEKEEAIGLFQKVHAAQVAKLGPDHEYTLTTLNNLAQAFWSIQKLDKSVPLFEEVLSRRLKQSRNRHPDTIMVAFNLALNYYQSGKRKEAIKLLDEWLPQLKLELPITHPFRSSSLDIAAYIYEGERLFSKAVGVKSELLIEFRKQLPPDDPLLASLLATLGLSMLNANQPIDAEPILRECLSIREKKEADSWATFNTYSMLGGSLLDQKKYADAEPLLLKGYEGMKQRETKIPPQGKMRLTEAMERLVQLYDDWGKKDEADKWRKKLEEAKASAKPQDKQR